MPVGEGLAVKQVVCFCAIPQQQSLEENKSTTQTNKKTHINNTQPSCPFSRKLLISLVSPCQFGWSILEVCYMQNYQGKKIRKKSPPPKQNQRWEEQVPEMLTERCATWASTFNGLSKDSMFPAAVLQLKGRVLTLGRGWGGKLCLRDWLAMENSHICYAFSMAVEPRDPFPPNAFDRLKRKPLAPKCQRSTKWKRGRIIFKSLKKRKKKREETQVGKKVSLHGYNLQHSCSTAKLCSLYFKGKGLWHKSTTIQKNKH